MEREIAQTCIGRYLTDQCPKWIRAPQGAPIAVLCSFQHFSGRSKGVFQVSFWTTFLQRDTEDRGDEKEGPFEEENFTILSEETPHKSSGVRLKISEGL